MGGLYSILFYYLLALFLGLSKAQGYFQWVELLVYFVINDILYLVNIHRHLVIFICMYHITGFSCEEFNVVIGLICNIKICNIL